ncbi:MAG TPA: hypothetical protein VF121_18170, partial [Thermoanaerobaculia bacterium]|nr:hypothetical protein [Thermoanaerobaculia bacterium]
ALLLAAALAAPLASEAPAPRRPELLRLDCASSIGRREVTLFERGTVRLVEGAPGKELSALRELGPDELDAFLRRFAEVDLSEVGRLSKGVEGEWVERCRFELALPSAPPRSFAFGRYDTLPLALARVLRIADELAAGLEVRPPAELPAGYRPQRGDLLRRADGHVYRVAGFTVDGRALELRGLHQPLTLYVLREELRREFVEYLGRGSSRLPPR